METPPQDVWRWLVATGRYRRYTAAADAVADTCALRMFDTAADDADGYLRMAATGEPGGWIARLGVRKDDLAVAVARRAAIDRAATDLTDVDAPLARAVRAEIVLSGDADALAFRYLAFRDAVAYARTRSLRPRPVDWHLAAAGIAAAHGYRDWGKMEEAMHCRDLWAWIVHARGELALVKRVRHELFDRAGGRPAPALEPSDHPPGCETWASW